MGVLVPDDFPLALLKNDEERLVVEALCDRLTDGWHVFPAVGLTGGRDREIDVVIAHERDGIAVIEVKGHRPCIEKGLWHSNGRPMEPQPLDQARGNAYELRNRIRDRHPSLRHVDVEYAVAFPNVSEIDGRLPPDTDASQVFTCTHLEDCRDAVDTLMTRRFGQQPLGRVGMQAVVELLRPDAEVMWESEARARLARLRLETICAQQVKALEGLDVNRRVCVTGGAGSGKTRLAIRWARRALMRGERTLLTCFNRPLAEVLANRLILDDGVVVGSFHVVARSLDGMPPIEIPDNADGEWWDMEMFGHLESNWQQVTERFDTIIVDEAQDFSPAWITLLTQLLDPAGPQRMMLLADRAQCVFQRGFDVPGPDAGWTLCELASNCRNSSEIATLLRRQFGGGEAPVGGPESEDIVWIEADGENAAVDAVGEAIDIVEGRDHGADRVLVATVSSSVRNRLRADYAFVPWEDRSSHAIVCENVHRVKGLEYDHVVLVVHKEDVPDEVLYVGASRPMMSLTVVAPKSIADRLGIAGTA